MHISPLPRLVLAVAALAAVAPAATPIRPVPPGAELRVATVQVRVAPDHRDWTYALGARAKFRITVTADNQPIDGASVRYTVGPELMPAAEKSAEVPLDGLVVEAEPLPGPGFVRCNVTTEINGRTYRGAAAAAFAPEKITPVQTEPTDFDAFWQRGREELARVPLEPRLTLLPEACSDRVDVYHVSFRTVGVGWTSAARIYGILCEPKAPGKFPAVLRVPGAGVRPYAGDRDTAARGVITLEIGVHGIPVNQPKEIYDQLLAGALRDYWLFNLDDRDAYYYRRVVLSSLRSVDFLAARPNWDGRNLLVAGASQGGFLAIATAALDGRVTGLAATHPALCDVTGDLHGRPGGWPRPFQPSATGPSRHATPAKIATTAYYDTVNFARRLKVPGYYTWGYNDDTCAPTSMFAAYNVIPAPKQLGLTLELGHAYTAEQWDAIQAWIFRALAP